MAGAPRFTLAATWLSVPPSVAATAASRSRCWPIALAAAVSPPSCSTSLAKRAASALGDEFPHMNLKLSKISQLANLSIRKHHGDALQAPSFGMGPGHRQPADGPQQRNLSRAAARLPDGDARPAGR